MSHNTKEKLRKPRKASRLSSTATEEKGTRATGRKAAALVESTTASARRAAAAAKKATAVVAKAAKKTVATVARKAAPPRKPKPAREPAEAATEVVVVQPHSTIEGAQPHAMSVGPNPVVAVRATAYEVMPPDRIIEPVYPQEHATELPREYGDTRLVLMVRDPEWIHFYWEIGKPARQMLGLPLNGSIESLVVRLHDITGVEEFNGTNSRNWYEIPISQGAISWYVHLPEVEREWCAEIGILNAQGEFVQICRSNTVRTPRNYIAAEGSDPEWMSVSEELREILARSADVAVSSRIGSEAAVRQISRKLRLALGKGVGVSAAPVGSMGAARIGRRPAVGVAAFPLTVRTELIVSGATDPQARVTIQGQPVVVRPDGSFTLRFELPDGEQVIPVRAVSRDGTMSREIVPVVRRATRYPSDE